MDEKILLYPDVKIYVRYNNKGKYWRAKVTTFPMINEKAATLSDVLNKVIVCLEKNNNNLTNLKRKEIINKIIASDFFIEYNGRFYLCIYKSTNDEYKAIYSSMQQSSEGELKEIEINKAEVEMLIQLINNLGIIPVWGMGLGGRISYLKVGLGLCSTTFIWWSGVENSWDGLVQVIHKISEIKKKTEDIS